jgi:HAD superfamily phosphoserine phosphatase-like hydrolase
VTYQKEEVLIIGPPYKLIVFDLDGTLLRGKSACELVASPIGRLKRMQDLERITDFEEMRHAREEIASWYRSVPMEHLIPSLADATLAPGAVEGCEMIRQAGVTIAIASITWSFAVEYFARKLGASYSIGTVLDHRSGTVIEHCWPDDKAQLVKDLKNRLGLDASAVCAVGNSFVDLPMLMEAGLPIFVGPARVEGLTASTVFLPEADIREIASRIVASGLSGDKG